MPMGVVTQTALLVARKKRTKMVKRNLMIRAMEKCQITSLTQPRQQPHLGQKAMIERCKRQIFPRATDHPTTFSKMLGTTNSQTKFLYKMTLLSGTVSTGRNRIAIETPRTMTRKVRVPP